MRTLASSRSLRRSASPIFIPASESPAYEWNFGDVNPPVHTWSTMFHVHVGGGRHGHSDLDWFERAFHKQPEQVIEWTVDGLVSAATFSALAGKAEGRKVNFRPVSPTTAPRREVVRWPKRPGGCMRRLFGSRRALYIACESAVWYALLICIALVLVARIASLVVRGITWLEG
jgi:hypothetical protein